jgi:hypothetical protein
VAVDDARFGSVRLSARLSAPPSANSLLVLVHGLGGSSQSPYLFPATAAAHALGVATLRVSLRGADLRGEDFYHAGLTDDLRSYLAHPELAQFTRVALLGYSLGGHLCLRYASEKPDGRVVAVSTLCAPLNLDLSSQAFDAARFGLYRHHVLKSLKAMYRQVALRHDVTPTAAEADRIATIRQWDEQIVAPRHGFASAVDYYTRVSVGPRLHQIEVPTLVAYAQCDPVVPPQIMLDSLNRSPAAVEVWKISRGGHIGFPQGQAPVGSAAHAGGVDVQLAHWLLRHLS